MNETHDTAAASCLSDIPDWDSYFMQIAQIVATRSPDQSTQHGCVLVDADNRVISLGYNGPVQGLPPEVIQHTRPDKYLWMIHSEENAVMFAQRSLKGATAYITGPPCAACFRKLAQMGVVRVVCGNRVAKMMDQSHARVVAITAKAKGIELIQWQPSGDWGNSFNGPVYQKQQAHSHE